MGRIVINGLYTNVVYYIIIVGIATHIQSMLVYMQIAIYVHILIRGALKKYIVIIRQIGIAFMKILPTFGKIISG